MPRFADPSSFVVNCAVTPMVSLDHWIYERNGGVGGSAAYSILSGNQAVQTELAVGVGWQDPAIIYETGLCAWHSGSLPVLAIKTNGDWLRGLMALIWTGSHHDTPSLVSKPRALHPISDAGRLGHLAVQHASKDMLHNCVNMSYAAQLDEGMAPLPHYPNVRCKKYCGSGFGGYALYLFTDSTSRDNFVGDGPGRIAIEPFLRSPGA